LGELVEPKIRTIALVVDDCTFFLTQFVDAPAAFVVAIQSYSHSSVPIQITHFKSFRMPNVRFCPSELSLSQLINVEQVFELSSVLSAFGSF